MIRILISYLIISIITWGILSPEHSLSELFWGILGFKTIGYAWYLEMYIGLFLLIPFLNIVIKKVYDAGNKRMIYAVSLTAMILTALHTMVSREGHIVLSRYWEMNFPVTFYLLGAYIRMYQLRLPWKYISIAIFILCINPIICVIIGSDKLVSITGAYYGIMNIVAVYILFVIFYPIKKVPAKKVVTVVSFSCLEMYLISFVTDKMLYPVAMEHFYTTQSKFLIWFVRITSCLLVVDFLCAFALKKMINFIYK